MADLYVYKTSFEPILLPREQAHVVTASSEFDVECVAVGALPEYVKDFGALTAATWDTDNEDTNLEMSDNELAQFRMRVMSDCELRFNNLAPTRQWRTAKTNFTLKQWPGQPGEDFLKEFLFKASEFFVWGDDTPRFDFYSATTQTTSVVSFHGWRFKCKKVRLGVSPAKTIWVSGWPSGQGA